MNVEANRCRKCGLWQPLENFKRSDAYRDGYTNVCKLCINKRARELARIERPKPAERIVKHVFYWPAAPEILDNKYWTVTRTDYRKALRGL